jgi:AraC-like DNA-binding protein
MSASNQNKKTNYVFVAITTVQAHLDKYPLDEKTTSELAQYAGISRNVLQRAFKEVHNVTIREYKRKLKMAMATSLLVDGHTVKVISHKLRYGSQSAFTTAFKNHFKLSPTEWLRNNS